MDDARISQLKAAAPLSGSEYIPITQLKKSTNVLRTVYTDVNAFKDFVFDAVADSFCPPGLIISYAGSVSSVDAPSGWLLCDGRSVMRSTYGKLFDKIGTTYGSVNDKSFNLPNLKGKVVMGYCDTTASTNLSSVFNSYIDDYIQYGLRFRSSGNTYLSRTPTIAGNRRTWTWSGWVKRTTIGTGDSIFHWGSTQNDFASIAFGLNNKFYYQNAASNVVTDQLATTQTFTDTSKWYHIVIACDTTQAVNANKMKIYVDGVLINSFSIATYPATNFQTYVNSTQPVFIGKNSLSGIQPFDGSLAEINFIEGQALAASDFGQTNACGAWVPKTYTGTYGTNGFYLNFADRSAMTAAAIGNDASPNNNNFTPNNFTLNDAVDFKTTSNEGAPTVSVGSVGGAFNHQLVLAEIPLQPSSITIGPINITTPTATTATAASWYNIYSWELFEGTPTVNLNSDSIISGGLKTLFGGTMPARITFSYNCYQMCASFSSDGSWVHIGCAEKNSWISGSVTVVPSSRDGSVLFRMEPSFSTSLDHRGLKKGNISVYIPGKSSTTSMVGPGPSQSIAKSVDTASALPISVTQPYMVMNYIIKY